jgi:hypothetical protein
MYQPYVVRVIGIKTTAELKVLKKLLPFGSYPICKVDP